MCPCTLILLILAAILGLVYIFLIWNFNYWKKRGIKQAKSYPFYGSFPSLFTQKQNIADDVEEIYREFKNTENVVGVTTCRIPMLMILNAEYAHKVYVNEFKYFKNNEFANFVSKDVDSILANNPFALKDEEWKERRAEITPGLTNSRIQSVYPSTLEVCNDFVKYIKRESKLASKDGLDAKMLALRFQTEIVSDCVLGIKANNFSDQPAPIFDFAQKMFDQSYAFLIYTALYNLIPKISKFYVARFFSKSVEIFFIDLMKKSISLRRNAKSGRVDFLNYILQLQDKKNLSLMDLTSHTITFMTDGIETSSCVLSHTLLLLARNQHVQDKLREEIGVKELTFEELNDLTYLEACVYESIRLFSPLLIGRKICTERYEFVNKNGHGVFVEPGDVILVPVHSLHHDEEYFDDPEEYKPERFTDENGGVKKYRDMGAFLGFGDGPRICFGMRFALTQIKSAVVEIVRNFNIKPNPKTRKDNKLHKTYFLGVIEGGIWLDFEER